MLSAAARDIMDQFDLRRGDRIGHGGTFNNNVLTMAGRAGLRAATAEAIGRRTCADRLRASLETVAKSRAVPFHAKGYGSIVSMQFQEIEPRRPDDRDRAVAQARISEWMAGVPARH